MKPVQTHQAEPAAAAGCGIAKEETKSSSWAEEETEAVLTASLQARLVGCSEIAHRFFGCSTARKGFLALGLHLAQLVEGSLPLLLLALHRRPVLLHLAEQSRRSAGKAEGQTCRSRLGGVDMG